MQGNNTSLSTDKYVQSLYAMALDCLDIPLAVQRAAPHSADVMSSPRDQSQCNSITNVHENMDIDDGQAPGNSQAAESSDGPHDMANEDEDLRTLVLEDDDEADDNINNDVDPDQDGDNDYEPDFSQLDQQVDTIPGRAFMAGLASNQADNQLSHSREGSPVAQRPSSAAANFPGLIGNPMAADMMNVDFLADIPVSPSHSPDSAGTKCHGNRDAVSDAPTPEARIERDDSQVLKDGVQHQPQLPAQLPLQGQPPLQSQASLQGQPPLQDQAPLDGQAQLQGQPPLHGLPGALNANAAPATMPATAPLHTTSAANLQARAAQRPPAAPRCDMYSQNTAHQPKPNPANVPLATKVGSLYAVYCLYETQPGHTPIYLPLELLQQLLNLVKEAHAKMVPDAVEVMRQLISKHAIVVGAVRRPPWSSPAAEAAAQPPSRSDHVLTAAMYTIYVVLSLHTSGQESQVASRSPYFLSLHCLRHGHNFAVPWLVTSRLLHNQYASCQISLANAVNHLVK